LLGGAPGAGKGTHTRFIMKEREFSGAPIIVSSLLNTPAMRRIKDSGGMVGDREVVGLLFREMLKPEYRDGALLDGFPRTEVQVECLKMLVDKIHKLHQKFKGTPNALHFRRPVIHVMVLFVEEHDSVERQLKRGQQIKQHNMEVERTGVGKLQELRVTDLAPDAARGRYRVFKEQTWDALQSLQEIYHYHFVNAQGSVKEVEANILRELKYQSSLELDPNTFDLIRGIPLASEIARNARSELVKRLDGYAEVCPELFREIVELISTRFMPIIIRHANSGRAVVNSEANILNVPQALSILIDIFSDRGYHATVDKRFQNTPYQFDLETGDIKYRTSNIYRIHVVFKGSEIRRG
jgi:adenylate kinase